MVPSQSRLFALEHVLRLARVEQVPCNPRLCVLEQVLVLAGEPLDEPIAARGPFVMNTQEELSQANSDYYSGNFGMP